MQVTIIGVDCATEPGNRGLALDHLAGGDARIDKVARGSREPSIAQVIRDWAGGSDRTLLALDAPLGWPEHLGSTRQGCPTLTTPGPAGRHRREPCAGDAPAHQPSTRDARHPAQHT